MVLVIKVINNGLNLQYIIAHSCDIVKCGREDENNVTIEVGSLQSRNRSTY